VSDDIPHLLEQAAAARADGNRADSDQLYRRILAEDEHHHESWHGLALNGLARDRYDVAVAMADKAIAIRDDVAAYHAGMNGSRGWLLHEGLAAVSRMTARANEYTAATTPWAVAKDPARAAELAQILSSLIRRIARQTVLLAPFMPTKVEAVWAQLGGPGTVAAQRFDALADLEPAGWRVRKGDGVFPRPAPAATT
jgi:methionyl-tRNA synthetase